jgi:eukaryotic-like serine/threonine-protein kinase
MLGIAYAQMGRTQDALSEFQWAIDHSPVSSAQYNYNASQALVILGRFDDAKSMLDQWRRSGSLSPPQIILRYRIAFFENDDATMQQLAHQMSVEHLEWVDLQENLAFYRGDIAQLRALSEARVGWLKHANRMEDVALELASRASDEAKLGNYALTKRLCSQAREAREGGNGSFSGFAECAMALADAGDTKRADALATKLSDLSPEDAGLQEATLPVIRSTIERKEGNVKAAVDLLASMTQSSGAFVLYHRACAYMAAGDQLKAITDFQTVIENRGWPQWEVFAPLAQLGLARAYAMQGDREKSRKAYAEFFTTWKNADPDIPILKQAKAEYAKLH